MKKKIFEICNRNRARRMEMVLNHEAVNWVVGSAIEAFVVQKMGTNQVPVR